MLKITVRNSKNNKKTFFLDQLAARMVLSRNKYTVSISCYHLFATSETILSGAKKVIPTTPEQKARCIKGGILSKGQNDGF